MFICRRAARVSRNLVRCTSSLNNPTIKDEYEDKGYVVVPDVIDMELIMEARDHVDWLLGKNPGVRPEQLHHFMVTKDAFWVRLVSDPRLLQVASQFIGEDIALFATHYICKPPKDGEPVGWHQDGSYWPLKPMRVVTLWLSLDHSHTGNGCLEVIPYSHKGRLLKWDELKKEEGSVLGTGISDIKEDEAVNLCLKPGDVSIHHPNVIHGSKANMSDGWRRGLTMRYIPTTTKITNTHEFIGAFPSCFYLCGEKNEGVNEYNPWPLYHEDTSVKFNGWEEWNQRVLDEGLGGPHMEIDTGHKWIKTAGGFAQMNLKTKEILEMKEAR